MPGTNIGNNGPEQTTGTTETSNLDTRLGPRTEPNNWDEWLGRVTRTYHQDAQLGRVVRTNVAAGDLTRPIIRADNLSQQSVPVDCARCLSVFFVQVGHSSQSFVTVLCPDHCAILLLRGRAAPAKDKRACKDIADISYFSV